MFVLNSKRGQRFILKGLLVGQDDLIERVLTSVEQVSVHDFLNINIQCCCSECSCSLTGLSNSTDTS